MSKYSVLITGGCGFVGSNLAIQLKNKYPHYDIIIIDNLKRKGSELNIARLAEFNVEFIHGDIRNIEDIQIEKKIDFVIDAAAEPSVLAGIGAQQQYVINTNLNGTVNLLHLAQKHQAKFIFLSTSRVYPIPLLEKINYKETETRFSISQEQQLEGISSDGIAENFSLQGYRSLYGATKLCSELLIQEFIEFSSVNAVINRFGVIAGPYQMGKVDQGVIALWVARHFWKKEINYIGYNGTGKQLRDVLHIDDMFGIIDYQIHNFEKISGQTFNVGGGINNSVSLLELTNICKKITGNIIKENAVLETRRGDIPVYVTNNTKISQVTNWQPLKTIEQIVEDIFNWIKKDESKLEKIFNQ